MSCEAVSQTPAVKLGPFVLHEHLPRNLHKLLKPPQRPGKSTAHQVAIRAHQLRCGRMSQVAERGKAEADPTRRQSGKDARSDVHVRSLHAEPRHGLNDLWLDRPHTRSERHLPRGKALQCCEHRQAASDNINPLQHRCRANHAAPNVDDVVPCGIAARPERYREHALKLRL